MRIFEVEIAVRSLETALAFYGERLGFPLIERTPTALSVQVGATRLILRESESPLPGVYHLAFNIPPARFTEGVAWLKERTPLLPAGGGQEIFPFESWNAHAVYFCDPDGNILELIARHDLPDSSERFEILCISEVGVALEDIDAEAARLGLPDYKSRSESFRPVGDEEGLLILVKIGRVWWPTTDIRAAPLPLKLTLSTGKWVYPG